MMSCRKARNRLPRFIAGELPDNEAQNVREHVLACRECRGEFKRLTAAWAALGDMPAGGSASVVPQVIARVEAYERGGSGLVRRWLEPLAPSFAGAAAAVMLLGLVSGALLSSIYYPDAGREQPDSGSQAYSEALSDAPPESFFEMYLPGAGHNGKENSL